MNSPQTMMAAALAGNVGNMSATCRQRIKCHKFWINMRVRADTKITRTQDSCVRDADTESAVTACCYSVLAAATFLHHTCHCHSPLPCCAFAVALTVALAIALTITLGESGTALCFGDALTLAPSHVSALTLAPLSALACVLIVANKYCHHCP